KIFLPLQSLPAVRGSVSIRYIFPSAHLKTKSAQLQSKPARIKIYAPRSIFSLILYSKNQLLTRLPAMDTYNEISLLSAVAKGDESAFRQLFDQYWDNIYGVAFTFTKSPVIAEEMAQDVFVKIWLKRAELPQVKKFGDYLFIIARNH